MVKIAVVGSVNRDFLALLPEFPGENMKCRATRVRDCVGGAGANTAAWIANSARCQVMLFSWIGNDHHGDRCLQELASAGVDTSCVYEAQSNTSIAFVWVASGVKRIVTSGIKNSYISDSYRGNMKRLLEGVAHLHVVGNEDEAVCAACGAAKSLGVPVSVDLNGRQMPYVRKQASYVVANSREFEAIFSLKVDALCPDVVADLCGPDCKALIVTHGPEFIRVATRTEVVDVDVEPAATMVDRTGGGDSFCAGLIEGLCGNLGIQDAVRKGHELSVRCFRNLGGQP